MLYTSIPAHEAGFKQNGVDNAGKAFILRPLSVKIPGENNSLDLIEANRQNGDKSFYFEQVIPKRRIVLHFTAGYLKGDICTLSTPGNHVSVPFVLARSGDIYNLWSSKYWSYHLGPKAAGGNTEMSSSSIGIEISNIGPLRKIGNNLVTMYRDDDIYCSLSDTAAYIKANFRDQQYFAAFTSAQYESLVKLLRFLTAKYTIPRAFVAADRRFALLPEVAAFSGIVTHANFRADKSDIGPAFDWQRVIDGLLAKEFVAKPKRRARKTRATAKKTRASSKSPKLPAKKIKASARKTKPAAKKTKAG
jgi:N-acetylmuramoyl-L-alanine amidase